MFCIVVCLHLAMQKRTSIAQIVNRQSKTVINLSSSLYQILRFLLPIAILSFKSQSSYCILKQSAKTTKKAKGKTIFFSPWLHSMKLLQTLSQILSSIATTTNSSYGRYLLELLGTTRSMISTNIKIRKVRQASASSKALIMFSNLPLSTFHYIGESHLWTWAFLSEEQKESLSWLHQIGDVEQRCRCFTLLGDLLG